jgi:pyridoxamine 5'-phosphate oxidase
MSDPRARPLNESDLDGDPFAQFGRWFEEAQQAGAPLAEAMALATATASGRPSVRMVLLKGVNAGGFVFYSDYESRKGGELAETRQAALLFYWHLLGRQVRAEGAVEPLSAAQSDSYFATRPFGARVSAAVSRQSQVVAGREELERQVEELVAKLGGADVPRPERWGGYRLEPEAIEFWQHREDRLHDRLRYQREGGAWVVERLSP